MKTKNLLAAVAVGVLALSPMGIQAKTVYATNEDGSKEYDSIDSAWSAAQDGTTIVLSTNWDLDSRLVLDKKNTATIKTNGYKISRNLTKSKFNGEVFKVGAGATLNLDGSTRSVDFTYDGYGEDGKTSSQTVSSGGLITGGYSCNGGGAIHMKEGATLNLNSVAVCGNKSVETVGADGQGGAIYMDGDGDSLNANNCNISYNYAKDDGGAIYADDEKANLTFNNCTLSYNTTKSSGGAICLNEQGTTNLTNSYITNNHADDKGGGYAILTTDASNRLEMHQSYISYNTTDGNGGGVYAKATAFYLFLTGGSVDHNSAKDCGGGYYSDSGADAEGGHVELEEGATINDNTAKRLGGGVFFNYSRSWIESYDQTGKMCNNKVTASDGAGGAVYFARVYHVSYENSARGEKSAVQNIALEGNEAYKGGAVYADSEYVQVRYCTLTGNKASMGSAIYVDNDDFTLDDCTVTGNTATDAESGAIQVSATDDIEAFGKIIIKDNYNEGSQTNRNLVLGESLTCDSYLMSAFGYEEGSYVGISIGSERKFAKQLENPEYLYSDDPNYAFVDEADTDNGYNYRIVKSEKVTYATGTFTNDTDTTDSSTEESTESTDTTEEAATSHVVKVTFTDNADWSDSDEVAYLDNDDAKLTAPTITGKTFKEWQNLPEGATVEDDNTVNFGKLTEDVEVTCVFESEETQEASATGSVFGNGSGATLGIAAVVACVFGAGGFFAGKKSGKKD